MKSRNWLVSQAILAAVIACTVVPGLRGEDLDRCQQRIAHADHELHEAVARHGRHSKQANHERSELREARERCWRERHAWWDQHEHRWHKERDWNDREHD